MDTLLTILEPILPMGMKLSLKKCLMSILQSMIITWSVNLLKLASGFMTGATVGSSFRQIQRFLLRCVIKQHDAARSIVDSLPEKMRLILSMDGTSWCVGKHKYYVLAVGICFDGIALPICFAFLPGHDITSFVDEIEIMERVVSLLGRERIECLLADREFGNSRFLKWLKCNNIKFCIRLRENLKIKKDGDKNVRSLKGVLSALKVGESVVLREAYIINGNNKVRIYATRRIGRDCEESLIILASPVDYDCTEKLYRRRWALETAFRGLKTAGFNMEDSHLNDKRFQNMLILLMIAFAAAFINGLLKIETLPIPLKKKEMVKRISIFRYGFISMLHDFWSNVKAASVYVT